MKKNILSLLILLTFSAPNIFAENSSAANIQDQLQNIYNLYKTNPAESCQQLETTVQSAEMSTLNPQKTKEAYYFLGNCQYKLKKLDQSVLNYEKIATLDSNDPQPLIDAGSVYVELGQYKKAEETYKKALNRMKDSPPEKSANVQALIDKIPGKLQRTYTVSTGIGYDSNVNSGPKDTTHFLYDTFNYTLSSDEKARDDFYNITSLDAAFSQEVKPLSYVLLNFGADHTAYFQEDDFNTAVLSTSIGYKKVSGNKSVTISPFVNYETLDKDSYQISSGLNLSGAVRVSEKINFWPSLSGYAQSFYNNNPRDAAGVSIGSSLGYTFNTTTSWLGSLFYTYNDAKSHQYSYNNVFLGNSLNRTLTENLTAALGYNLQLYYYDDPDPVFGTSRKDNGHNVFLNFNYSLKKLLKIDRSFLSLNVSYNQNNSNHSFQENNRLFSVFKFTVSF